MAEESTIPGVIGSSIGEAAAFAAGVAVAPLLEPYLQVLRNETWKGERSKPLDPHDAAAMVAERLISLPTGQDEAGMTGIGTTPFAQLVGITYTAPGFGELIRMLRRGTLKTADTSPDGEDDFDHGLRKAKFEQRWFGPLTDLQHERISVPDLAYMVVRGVVPDAGTLPSSLPKKAEKLLLPDQLVFDTLAEAAAGGFDVERFTAMVDRSGLAMAPVMAANAYFRGHITLNDYYMTIARGDLYPAFADPVLDTSRQILTADQAAELQLRGYLVRDDPDPLKVDRLKLTRAHGMTDAESDLLYDVKGRGMNLHSAFIAERRGGVFEGPTNQIPDWALYQLQRGNLRPEVYNLEWAQRESYPTAFVIRALATGKVITRDEAFQLFMGLGWPEWVATKAADFYSTQTTSGGQSHTAKAQTQLWSTTHRSFISGESDEATAISTLQTIGLSQQEISEVIALWTLERDLIRKQLTPAQIKKAVSGKVTNRETGQPWTRDDALAALIARGYSAQDAATFLDL